MYICECITMCICPCKGLWLYIYISKCAWECDSVCNQSRWCIKEIVEANLYWARTDMKYSQHHTHTHKAKTCQGRWCDNRRAQSSSLSIGYREHFVKRGVMGNKHLAPREGLGYSPTLWCFTTPYVWACGYWLLTSDAHGQMDATPDQNRAWGDEIGLYLGFKGIKWIYIIQDEFKTRLLNPLLSGSSRDQRKRRVLILPSVNKMVFPSWLNIRSSVKK